MRIAIALAAALGLGLCVFAAGCISAGKALESKASGTAVAYAVSPGEAWSIAESLLKGEGAAALGGGLDAGYMTANLKKGYQNYDTFVVVWFDADPKGTLVTCVTKREYPLGLATALTEGGFHDGFRRAVEMRSGGAAK